MGHILNEPDDAGRALGAQMARICEQEIATRIAEGKSDPARCDTCAYRAGTYANGCVGTLMDALKCAMEGVTFYCHEDDKPCRGAALMQFDNPQPGCAPWPFVGLDDETAAAMGA